MSRDAIQAAIEALDNVVGCDDMKCICKSCRRDILAAEAFLRAVKSDAWELIGEKHKDSGPWMLLHKPFGFVRVCRYLKRSNAWLLIGSDALYALDYFTHARPLPDPPAAGEKGGRP